MGAHGAAHREAVLRIQHRPGPAASGRADFLGCKPSDCARKLLHRRQSHATLVCSSCIGRLREREPGTKRFFTGAGLGPPAAGPARCTGITVVAPPNPGGDRGNRGPARWNRRHAGLSPGQAWYNRRAIRPKRRSLPPEAHALGRLNPSGCAGYNERGARLQREGPRLQRAPLSLNSTGLLLVAAVRSLLATSPRVLHRFLRESGVVTTAALVY